MLTYTLNNQGHDPCARTGCLPVTTGGDERRGRRRARRRLPTHRHRGRLRHEWRSARPSATAGSTGPRSSSRRRWISDYGYEQTLHAFDKSAGKLGVDQIDLFYPPPGAALGLRRDPRGLPRVGDPARRRQGPRDRRQQLHGRAPHLPDRRRAGRAGGEPEVHPYFQQRAVQDLAAEHGMLTQAWSSSIGGITLYRDGSTRAPWRTRHRRDRRGARQEPCPGHARLAPAGGAARPSPSPRSRPASPRTSTSSTSSSPRSSSRRSTPSTPVVAGVPSPRRSRWTPSASHPRGLTGDPSVADGATLSRPSHTAPT